MEQTVNLARMLLIDDNPVDQESVVRTLRKINSRMTVDILSTGEEAVHFLEQIAGSQDKTRFPDLILLDLKLERFSGLEILKQIKRNEFLNIIPTIIFSSSRSRNDIRESYRLGANGFVTKPHSLDGLVDTMQRIVDFWGDTAELPTP
ncbi:MAG: response regulator [Alphaproteobacteria bacterium]